MASSSATSIIGLTNILVGTDTWDVTCCHKAYHTEVPDTGDRQQHRGMGEVRSLKGCKHSHLEIGQILHTILIVPSCLTKDSPMCLLHARSKMGLSCTTFKPISLSDKTI